MLRYDLLEKSYHFEMKEPKKSIINLVWAGFALLLIFPALLLYLMIFNGDIESMNLPLPYLDLDVAILNIMFIAVPFLYFISKEVLTSMFCSNKNSHGEMKLSSDIEMPISVYREAFKTWQVIIIYLLPMIVMYPLLMLISVMTGENIYILIMILIMSFLMSFDLTLTIYALLLKIRYDYDYIAVNNHVYSLTLYSKTYVERKKYDSPVKTIKKKIKSINIPGLSVKKVIIPVIIIGLFAVILNYVLLNKDIFYKPNPDDFDTYLEYCDAMNPAIRKYDGDIYSDIYGSSAGGNFFAGCEILAGNNIIYCNDDDTVIYFDDEKDSVMRLGYGDKSERLCIYEDCRNNLNENCGHMPNFLIKGCYTNNVLYGVRSYTFIDKKGRTISNSYIIRYGTESNLLDKLIEFEMGDESSHIHKMFANGRYLYAVVSADDMTQLTVVRINLVNQDACIVYADEKDANDRDKIEELIYYRNNIYCSVPSKPVKMTSMPVGGSIYSCSSDMTRFNLIEPDLGCYAVYKDGDLIGYKAYTARQIDVYGDYMYYSSDNGAFYRCNMKLDRKEMLHYNIQNFYINDDMLYYNTYGDTIYRLKLDDYYTDSENEITYIDFANSTEVYKPEPGCTLDSWSIKDDYIYAVLSFNENKNLTRIKINSNSEPYIIR